MKCAGKGFLDVCGLFTAFQIVLVYASVETLAQGFGLSHHITVIQGLGRIEFRLKAKQFAHVGKHEAVGKHSLEAMRHLTGKKDALAVFVCESGFGLQTKVHAVEGQASQRHIGRTGKHFCQLLLCLYFNVIRTHILTPFEFAHAQSKVILNF